MLRTLPQNKRLHDLLTKTKLMPRKAELIASFTNERTEHSSQMESLEIQQLIAYLEGELNKQQPQPQFDQAANRMRRKVLSICHQLGWYVRDEKEQLKLKAGKPQIDFTRIDNFCINRGKAKKPFQQHTAPELQTLIYQIQNLFKSELKRYESTR